MLLQNPFWAKPFERILAFFPPPVYGSLDPVTSTALFFPLFFGLIIGDAGYASVIILFAWSMVLRRKSVPIWSDLAWILFACGLSSLFFGLIFGEFFGFSAGYLPPSLFDRQKETMTLLSIILGIGALHLSLGNIMGAVDSLRSRFYWRGLGNILAVSLIWFGGLAVWQFFSIGKIAWETTVVLLATLFIKILAEGATGLIEGVRLLSSVLSYARLMALGVASLMLAATANRLYSVSGPLVGVLSFAALHLLNMSVGFFSPFVQSLRLHVVEFFGQFVREGVVRFEPFGTD